MIGKIIVLIIIIAAISSVTYVSLDVGTDTEYEPNFRCERINNSITCGWIINETSAGGDAEWE